MSHHQRTGRNQSFKSTATQILQQIDLHLNNISRESYTEAQIDRLLWLVFEKISLKEENKEHLIGRLRLKEENIKIDVLITRLAGSLRKQDLGKKAIDKLLYFYFVLVDPVKAYSTNDPLKLYPIHVEEKMSIKTPPKILQYLLYYWNHGIKDVELGLISLSLIKIEEGVLEWEKGTIKYFKKLINGNDNQWVQDGEFRPLIASRRSNKISTISILTGMAGNASFSLNEDAVFCNSFRVLTKDSNAMDRKIMMCSYSAATEQGTKPTSGMGIVARIGALNELKENYPVNQDPESPHYCGIQMEGGTTTLAHRVPDEVTNILFDRRDSLRTFFFRQKNHSEHQLFSSFASLPNSSHVKTIGELSGLYFGYHLQNNYRKEGDEKSKRGALRTLILEILPSGICRLLDDEPATLKEPHPYSGFLSIKDLIKKKVLINMDRETDKLIEFHSWRLQFYIKQIKEGILEGVVSGFSIDKNQPVTSPVRFKKSHHYKTIEQFMSEPKETNGLRRIFPCTLFKSEYHLRDHHVDIDILLDWDNEAVQYFTTFNENPFFNSPSQSLPHNFVNLDFKEYSRFIGLRGNYYLVSFSHANDDLYLSKAKIQLRNFGEAFVFYPMENDQNKLDVFIGRWDMHENGKLLKIRLKFRNRGIKDVNEISTSESQSFGDFIFHLDSEEDIANIDYLTCISVWVDYKNDNTFVAKREFLFPALENGSDKYFPKDFIKPFQYKFAVNGLDRERFFEDIRYFQSGDPEIDEHRRDGFLDQISYSKGNLITVVNDRRF